MEDARSNQYLTFFVADDEFGVSILEAREITQYTTVTKVPAMPAAVRGVINLRGRVVPVIDLALRFELEPQPVTQWTCVLIVDAAAYSDGTGLIGLIVDRVSQVIDVPAGEIELPPDFGTRVQRSFVRGMARAAKKFVLLLDIEQVLEGLQRGASAAIERASAAASAGAGADAPQAAPESAP